MISLIRKWYLQRQINKAWKEYIRTQAYEAWERYKLLVRRKGAM